MTPGERSRSRDELAFEMWLSSTRDTAENVSCGVAVADGRVVVSGHLERGAQYAEMCSVDRDRARRLAVRSSRLSAIARSHRARAWASRARSHDAALRAFVLLRGGAAAKGRRGAPGPALAPALGGTGRAQRSEHGRIVW